MTTCRSPNGRVMEGRQSGEGRSLTAILRVSWEGKGNQWEVQNVLVCSSSSVSPLVLCRRLTALGSTVGRRKPVV